MLRFMAASYSTAGARCPAEGLEAMRGLVLVILDGDDEDAGRHDVEGHKGGSLDQDVDEPAGDGGIGFERRREGRFRDGHASPR